MARYDYRCSSCGKVFEVEHPMTEHPDIACPDCGASAAKVFSASGISFQGSGFYNTDQRGGSSSTPATSGAGDSASASDAGSSCANCPHKND